MDTRFEQLKKQYPTFRYVGFIYELDNEDLRATFAFEIGEHKFFPKLTFRGVGERRVKNIQKEQLDLYVFHLGLAEIPSYWKLTCSPHIEIEAGTLNAMEVAFWQKLIEKGMGEFFFVNDIEPFSPSITSSGPKHIGTHESSSITSAHSSHGTLVPVGGGKDSIVTMELLKKNDVPVTLFTIGKDEASEQSIRIFESKYGKTNRIHVDRSIDPTLIELNARGYLNGHTPFSSVVAFTSLLAATLFDLPYIALSNERSANEETGVYHGVNINHQYSKTFEFESDFHSYVHVCFNEAPAYFSLLRPLYEIQIMSIFTALPEYFAAFRSCNIGKKENIWCGSCAKCLFVSLLLSAFLPPQKVIGIFGKDLLSDEKLIDVLKQLTGDASMKAFECVGTKQETMVALYLAWKKRQLEKPLPALLEHYREYLENNEESLKTQAQELLTAFDDENLIPHQFTEVISHALN